MHTDNYSDKLGKKTKNRINDLKVLPSGRPAFFIYIILLLLSTYGFSNSIPWSSEAATILYYNAPSSWVLGFENIKGLYKTVKEFNIEKTKTRFIEEFSIKNNIDSNVVKRFFESRIIIITDEELSFNFQTFFNNLFNVEDFLKGFFSVHTKNIICVEQFDGLETLMSILSGFQIESRPFGDFIAFSNDRDYLEKQFQLMLNRNEFSEDVIFYSESAHENVEITNAYSFLNFEQKEMIESRGERINTETHTQFLLETVVIPFSFEEPTHFEINSANELKSYFYERFTVLSSINEWLSVFDLLEKETLYTFFFSNDSNWLLGFHFSKNLLDNAQWERYVTSWGLDKKESIKPYADDYYLSLYDDYFLLSNFKVQKTDTNNQIISDILTKFERNLLLKAEVIDQNNNPDMPTLKMYHFSYIDDKIIKDLFRIF